MIRMIYFAVLFLFNTQEKHYLKCSNLTDIT